VSTESITRLRTLDGLHLAGTFVSPDAAPDQAVVLVHGGGVTREEGGFFTRLAAEPGMAGVRDQDGGGVDHCEFMIMTFTNHHRSLAGSISSCGC
jgi:hypothetical protein